MGERQDERTAKVTAGEESLAERPGRRRPQGPLWAWLLAALVVCVLAGWGVYAVLP